MNAPWIKVDSLVPPVDEVVETKIDDSDGCRNEQTLVFHKNLWFHSDLSMYVYYIPTHWRPLTDPVKEGY